MKNKKTKLTIVKYYSGEMLDLLNYTPGSLIPHEDIKELWKTLEQELVNKKKELSNGIVKISLEWSEWDDDENRKRGK